MSDRNLTTRIAKKKKEEKKKVTALVIIEMCVMTRDATDNRISG